MANTGNIFPGTGENNAGIGATAWTSPGNVVSDNTTDATCNAAASSQYLVARNFNFATVPTNATIDGITVRIEASESSTGSETLNARLQDEGAALVGNTKTASINGTGKTVYTYGATNDVWAASPTGNKVHDADWGVRFWFTTAHNIAVDYVTMALEYTVPGPGMASETDTALALGAVKIRATGMASETDTALALDVGGGFEAPAGMATETDTAVSLAAVKLRQTGVATETDAAMSLAGIKSRVAGMATETDAALALALEGDEGEGGTGPPDGRSRKLSRLRRR